jgi:predicted nucleic acid-binding protein
MTYLLDVNALIAALVTVHEHHLRVSRWLAGLNRSETLATCSISELGFVRVLAQAPQYRVPVADSIKTLTRFRNDGKRTVCLLSDRRSASDLPRWAKGARQVTDGHLLGLSESHGAILATLDEGIPGAFIIPQIA